MPELEVQIRKTFSRLTSSHKSSRTRSSSNHFHTGDGIYAGSDSDLQDPDLIAPWRQGLPATVLPYHFGCTLRILEVFPAQLRTLAEEILTPPNEQEVHLGFPNQSTESNTPLVTVGSPRLMRMGDSHDSHRTRELDTIVSRFSLFVLFAGFQASLSSHRTRLLEGFGKASGIRAADSGAKLSS